MKKTAKILTIFALALFLGTLLTGCRSTTGENNVLHGTVEVTEVDLNTKIPGRVLKVLVEEGDTVKQGQVVAKLDDKDLLAKEKQLKAQVSAARAAWEQAKLAYQIKSQVNQETLAKAKAQAEVMAKTLKRMEQLYAEGAIPEQKLDEIKAQAEAARANAASAEAALLEAPVAKAQAEAAQAKYEQAKAALEELRVNLEETEIKSPVKGTVTEVLVEEGELVSTGLPLVTVTVDSENWVNLKVPETKLKFFKEGQEIPVTVTAFPDRKFTGKVVNISKKPNFATSRATNDRGEKDIITYNVKIEINSPDLRPGMSVDITLPQEQGE
ncbi:HlyD family secretion protein [Desulfohalotomaculum tongense]|uniref:HlyD family secretion protein n=1 Tax=Desulforadius tongensis TaxID=1216062 RepID=UPI00195A0195|nr:efflux RND transporter periplasmic adaptor subunit [Desulforadius tongensis]MBM7853652.1 HlyD family secretion protein [Desulforadius tongensis]